jgi:hypothetical protein
MNPDVAARRAGEVISPYVVFGVRTEIINAVRVPDRSIGLVYLGGLGIDLYAGLLAACEKFFSIFPALRHALAAGAYVVVFVCCHRYLPR